MHFLKRPDNNSSPEYTHVELPFIRQLQALGWDYLEGDTGVPYLTERENFRHLAASPSRPRKSCMTWPSGSARTQSWLLI